MDSTVSGQLQELINAVNRLAARPVPIPPTIAFKRDDDGVLLVSDVGGGGGGSATLAEQEAQTALLDDINNALAVFPAAAALADSTANPTLTGIASFGMVYNGLWHRMRGDDGGVYMQGTIDHDAADTGRPIKLGGKASAAAPADVSADNDRVNAWFLRNGAQATALTAAGALIGGDATNGLDVDVTRIIPGTGATHLGKAVDSAAGATDTGVASLVVRDDALSTLTPVDGDYTRMRVDSTGALWTRETLAPAYEDNTNAKAVVEHRYTPFSVTADTLVKTGAGLVHTISISPTAATPTAGLVTIYDNTAESGTVLYSEWVFATAVGHTITLDSSFATGLYVGYDATLANVRISGSYR